MLQTAAWEAARLRVRATSLAAENDALKNHVAQLMHQISNMDRSVQVHESCALSHLLAALFSALLTLLSCNLFHHAQIYVSDLGLSSQGSKSQASCTLTSNQHNAC